MSKEWEDLTILLKQVRLNINKSDGWTWLLDGNSEYTVTFISKAVDKVKPNNRAGPMTWCPIILKKDNVFVWRATISELPNIRTLPSLQICVQCAIMQRSQLAMQLSDAQKSLTYVRRCQFGATWM